MPKGAPIIVIGVSVLLIFHIAEFLATSLFERCLRLRRFILGHEWIEGLWFDAVLGTNLFGIVAIHQAEGEPAIVGEQFDQSGCDTSTWENFVISFDGRTMRAIYRSPQFDGNATPSELLGFTTYVFTGKPHHPPTYYNGYFADMSSGSRKCQLSGYRITDEETIASLMNPDRKKSTRIELINQYLSNNFLVTPLIPQDKQPSSTP